MEVSDNTNNNIDAAGPEQLQVHSELPKLLLTIMQQLAEVMEVERASLFLYDKDKNLLWSAVSSGNDIDKICFPADKGIAGAVLGSGELLNIPDAYSDPRFNPEIDKKTQFKTRTILCVPAIDYDKKRIGVVQVLNKNNQKNFTATDEKMLLALAQQAAVAIENMQLREKEKAMALELQKNHRTLQETYLNIENKNANLQSRLQGKIWTKRFAVFFALFLCISVGGWFLLDNINLSKLTGRFKNILHSPANADVAPSTRQLKLQEQEVTEWLSLKGNIKPMEWIEVVSPMDSIVKKINFRYGDVVNKGQVLVELDTTRQQVELRDAHSSYITALDEMQRLRDWEKSTEVLRAKRDVAKAKEALNSYQRKLNETKRLYEKGIIARSEYESAETSLKESRLSVVAAEESLRSTRAQGSQSKLEIARLKLENAKQKWEESKALIEKAVIRSPASGIIFTGVDSSSSSREKSPKKTNLGGQVSRNTPIFAIANFQGITIESEVEESLILKLKRDQKVRVQFDALPNLTLDGHISYIAGRGTSNEKRQSQSKFKVVAMVPHISDEQRRLLRIGMSASAKVKIYHNQHALVIPFEAVQIKGRRRFVQVLNNNTAETREIKIRSTQPNGVEVARGLEPNLTLLIPERGYKVRKD